MREAFAGDMVADTANNSAISDEIKQRIGAIADELTQQITHHSHFSDTLFYFASDDKQSARRTDSKDVANQTIKLEK